MPTNRPNNAIDFTQLFQTSDEPLPWEDPTYFNSSNGNVNGGSNGSNGHNGHSGHLANGHGNGHNQVIDVAVVKDSSALSISTPIPSIPSPPASSYSPALQSLTAIFQHWLYLPDLNPLYAILGAVAAHRMPSNPVWLMLVGVSSGGKSELLNTLSRLDHIHGCSSLSEAALLSGTPSKEATRDSTGGLLRELGSSGIMVFKDFTTIFSMPHEKLTSTLAALREISDGKWNRRIGSDGGKQLYWEGKASAIAACTPQIDLHQQIIADMGERFIYCRLPELTGNQRKEHASRGLDNSRKLVQMKNELSGAVYDFFSRTTLYSEEPVLDIASREQVIAMSCFVSAARSSVPRAGNAHDITLRPAPDAPSRFMQSAIPLFWGMRAIGVPHSDAWSIVGQIGLDSMPAVRRKTIQFLAPRFQTPSNVPEIATGIQYSPATTRRVLEDLQVHGITCVEKGQSDRWDLTPEAWEEYATAFPHLI